MAEEGATAVPVERVRAFLDAADRADPILELYDADAVWGVPEGMGTFLRRQRHKSVT